MEAKTQVDVTPREPSKPTDIQIDISTLPEKQKKSKTVNVKPKEPSKPTDIQIGNLVVKRVNIEIDQPKPDTPIEDTPIGDDRLRFCCLKC